VGARLLNGIVLVYADRLWRLLTNAGLPGTMPGV
jgi:hypothetical protein